MKYENFAHASELVVKINKLEALKKEMKVATHVYIQEGSNYRSLSISLIREEPYSNRAKNMVQWILEDIDKEIQLLVNELAGL